MKSLTENLPICERCGTQVNIVYVRIPGEWAGWLCTKCSETNNEEYWRQVAEEAAKEKP